MKEVFLNPSNERFKEKVLERVYSLPGRLNHRHSIRWMVNQLGLR
jgi:hypothetical protein